MLSDSSRHYREDDAELHKSGKQGGMTRDRAGWLGGLRAGGSQVWRTEWPEDGPSCAACYSVYLGMASFSASENVILSTTVCNTNRAVFAKAN